MKAMGDWNKGWQAIAAEMSDYSKRTFEDGTATFEKLLGAKSLEQAFEIQSGFAKRAYDDYVQQLTKIGSMCTGLAKGLQARRESLSERQVMGRPSVVCERKLGAHGRPGLFCVFRYLSRLFAGMMRTLVGHAGERSTS